MLGACSMLSRGPGSWELALLSFLSFVILGENCCEESRGACMRRCSRRPRLGVFRTRTAPSRHAIRKR